MNCLATTTHTMVVELSHEVVISFNEVVVSRGNNLFLSPCSLSSTSSKVLCNTAWDDL
jgi:hypothetical protein